MEEKVLEVMARDLNDIKNALLGTLDNKQGLINRVLKLESFYKVFIWLASVSTVAVVGGCAKLFFG